MVEGSGGFLWFLAVFSGPRWVLGGWRLSEGFLWFLVVFSGFLCFFMVFG